ncbi:MAG: class C sortase [Acutalibacteraceae bacterium]|nr:class C sortase [Acutalibacteraceae bacterium]
MKKTSKIVTLALLIAFFIGLSVLLYPAISQYWNSRLEMKAIIEYEQMASKISDDDFQKMLEEARKYNEKINTFGFPLVEAKELEEYYSILNLDGKGMMGYIGIDKLRLQIPIYHGTSDSVLNKACGHLEGTSLPVGGKGTHCVLSAHRGLSTAKLFTELDKMEIGDVFTITAFNEVLTYQVDQIKIVVPTDTVDLAVDKNKDYCTLLTCTPYGINTHRLLVRGKRIETEKHSELIITSDAYLVNRLIVTPMVALPILFVLILYVIFKPVKKKPKIEGDDEV